MRVDVGRFIHALEELAEQGGSVQRPFSYSGRGMFGAQCVGVGLANDDDLSILGLNIVHVLLDEDDGSWKVTDILELLDELAAIFQGTRTDQFGLGIVAYWPRLDWPQEVPDKEGV